MNLRAAVLCDDVRLEDTNKQIFIGVYGDSIQASIRPAPFSAWLVIMLDIDEDGGTVELETSFGGKVELKRSRIPAGHRSANVKLALNHLFYEPTPIAVRFRKEGGEWSHPILWMFKFADDVQPLPDDEAARYAPLFGEAGPKRKRSGKRTAMARPSPVRAA
jgi:hypothetical protein